MSVSNLLKAKSEFRKKGVTLVADKAKTGAGGAWKFAGEDNLVKTIQEPLSAVGLEYIATMKAMPELNLNMVVGTLYHVESGEFIESSKVLETPVPKNDSNGNPRYLDAEIEAGKQFGYWSRILAIRLLGLSDIDPEDMSNRPADITDEVRAEKLGALKHIVDNDQSGNLIKWIKDTYKKDSIEKLSTVEITTILTALKNQKAA